jgi:hypothetical protein
MATLVVVDPSANKSAHCTGSIEILAFNKIDRYEHCVFYITNEMLLIQCSLLLSALYMFRAVFPPIIRRCGWVGTTHPHQRQTAGKHDNTEGCTYSFISS